MGIRLVAFYLPQFHPIEENSRWWGPGFTDWHNVVRGRPLFRDHYQPHLPGELGFYDLRLSEVREAQADLARAYGIDAFCYFHYWFAGRRLLERPFEEVLLKRSPDFPFMLCWANEPWTRNWDGHPRDILMQQTYSLDDDRSHIEWLIKAFRDQRYLRINGAPIFLVYRAALLPRPKRTAEVWREAAAKAGFQRIILGQVQSFRDEHLDPQTIGFDIAVEFQPDWTRLGRPLWSSLPRRLLRRLGLHNRPNHIVFDYRQVVSQMGNPQRNFPFSRCVTPMWDNTTRRARQALVFRGSSPDLYAEWLSEAISWQQARPEEEGLVFLNAWNEWAEGNHLEPCQRWGRAYLEATLRVRQRLGIDDSEREVSEGRPL